MRLNRFLSKAGIASRRAADELVSAGRVQINGEIVTALGTQVDEAKDKVLFDGKPVSIPDDFVYIVMNKPTGYLVTCRDEFNRPKVMDLAGKYKKIVRPVGRLDNDSSGLLLLTNDGELAFRLSHPKFKIDKQYRVKCSGYINDENLEMLRNGVELDDGKSWPADVELISRTRDFTKLDITIHEGRKRQVRRMCQAIGHRVMSLSRIKYGDLELGNLKSGTFRLLESGEVDRLKRSVGYAET